MPVITASSPWGHVQRDWGYEVRVDFTGADGTIANEVLTFSVEPSSQELEAEIAARKARLEYVAPDPPAEYALESEDGTTVNV